MARPIAVIGIVLLLLGAGLFVTYYPFMCYSAQELKMLENTSSGVTYDTFREGDAITVFGQVTKISYSGGNNDVTGVQLDFVDLTPIYLFGVVIGHLNFVVGGDLTKKHSTGDNIQMKAVLVETLDLGNLRYLAWKVLSVNDVQPMIVIQGIFIAVAVVGLLLLIVGIRNKRGAAPPRA